MFDVKPVFSCHARLMLPSESIKNAGFVELPAVEINLLGEDCDMPAKAIGRNNKNETTQ